MIDDVLNVMKTIARDLSMTTLVVTHEMGRVGRQLGNFMADGRFGG